MTESSGTATITITRTGGSSGAVGVTFTTSNGTAIAGSDYTPVTQTVTFAGGDTANKTVAVPILNNGVAETSETVNLALSSPTGGATVGSPGTAVLTITDDDSAGPSLAAGPTSVVRGNPVTVSWAGIGAPTATDWIGLYAAGAPSSSYLAWVYVSCSEAPGSAAAAGSCAFPVPSSLTPGTYELRLFANDQFTLLATSNPLTVTAPGGGGPTMLTVTPATIARGGTVTASWSGIAAPTSADWIGLFAQGASSPSYLHWVYVTCTQAPGGAAASGSCAFLVPSSLTAGTYELRLFANDQFTVLATSNPLTVTAPGGGPTTLTVTPGTVARGGTVTASWNGIASPTATDWIGLYTPGAPDTSFLAWVYVSCAQTPAGAAASGSCGVVVPSTVAAGTYQLRLLGNEQFNVLATSSAFTVQ